MGFILIKLYVLKLKLSVISRLIFSELQCDSPIASPITAVVVIDNPQPRDKK